MKKRPLLSAASVLGVMLQVDPKATYSLDELANGFEVENWRMSVALNYLRRRGKVERVQRGNRGRTSLWKVCQPTNRL